MPNNIEVLSVTDLLQREFPATDSLLGNGLIDKQGAILISGPQKIGKSLFGTQLGLSLASRTPFLGFDTGDVDYRVLILQAEVAAKRMKERFACQVRGFPGEAAGRVLTASVFSSVRLDTAEGTNAVHAWIDQYEPDLLVVDPFSNFHGGDENIAQDVLKLTTILDSVRAKGVAVVVVHHHAKNSSERRNVGYKARGSSALAGWYDSHFSLEWAEFGQTVRLQFELRHDETPEDRILRLNRDSLLFEVQDDQAAQISLVITALRELGPSDAEPVGTHCKKTRQWASRWLNEAVHQERVVRSGNRPILFSLPGEEPPTTRVEIPNPNGGQPIVVSTNTGRGGGVHVEEGARWYEEVPIR